LRRVFACITFLVSVFFVSAEPLAVAENRGSDPFSEVVNPAIEGGLSSEYPSSSYQLDYHIDTGLNPLGWGAEACQWLTNMIWMGIMWAITLVTELFTWAFNLDLLNGPRGALKPVAAAMENLQDNVFGDEVLYLALTVTGIWAVYQLFHSQKTAKVVGSLAKRIACIVIALFFLVKPVEIYGSISSMINSASVSILSGVKLGTLNNPDAAQRAVRDQIFETNVLKPWAVLQFGGLIKCVDMDNLDSDGFPAPVNPTSSKRDICRNVLKQGADGHGGYAKRFLDQAPGSDERKAEYEALAKGEVDLPTPRRGDSNQEERQQFAGYSVDKADSPSVDMMQEAHAYTRLGMVILFALGAIFFLALFARLAFAIVLMTAVALVLLLMAPVALIAGALPFERSDAFFHWWLSKMAIALVAKLAFSFLATIMLVVSATIIASSVVMGYLASFFINGCLWFFVYKYRSSIASWVGGRSSGIEGRLPAGMGKSYNQTRALVTAGVVAPVSAIGGAVAGWKAKDEVQEPAQSPTGPPPVGAPPQEPAPTPPIEPTTSTTTGDRVTMRVSS
jgi:hypothetical protein